MDAYQHWAKNKTIQDVLNYSRVETFVAGWEEGEAERVRLREALTTIREDCRDALAVLPDLRIRRVALASAINVVDETLPGNDRPPNPPPGRTRGNCCGRGEC